MKSVLPYVNPLQGTASTFNFSNGNTLPLVARPFGMAAWSAQTNEAGGGWFYHPSHRHFEGLRLTHQPSPWIGDYGHLTVMPQTGPLFIPASSRSSSFRSADLVCKPDYYKIRLQRYRATLELSPTERCAVMRMTFEEKQEARVIVAPFAGLSAMAIDVDAGRVTGYTRANAGGVPDDYAMYFVMEFDCGLDEQASGLFDEQFRGSSRLHGEGERVGAFIGLNLPESGQTILKVATSFISFEQAQRNLEQEIGGRGFEEIRQEASRSWEETLGRIQIEDRDEDKKRTFYTCLYRLCLFPRMWHEHAEDGRQIHYSPYSGEILDGPMYCDNGFWDTYRTSYPLFSLLFPTRLGEMLEGYVNAYKEGGWMPKWSSPGERSAMPGTLIDAVFADAHVKGIDGYDVEAAYEGLMKHALQAADDPRFGRKGSDAYNRYGYLPADEFHECVSNTLDYVYGDFCLSQLAQGLGKTGEYEAFRKRAGNYAHLLDAATGFMRGKKADGSWLEPFDHLAWGGAYCEGGAWQCSWAVQHDIMGLAGLMGGKKAFQTKLTELMTTAPEFKIGGYGYEIHEMSEMAAVDFGQFAISNQPSFHIPYLFAAVGNPVPTQYWVRRAAEELFDATPEGLPGDEDNGSLSAWYIFACMGMYPLCPGVPEYVIGSPMFRSMTVQLENGGQIRIETGGSTEGKPYVHNVQLNNQPYSKLYLTHQALVEGAHLRYELSDVPLPSDDDVANKDLPYSMSIRR